MTSENTGVDVYHVQVEVSPQTTSDIVDNKSKSNELSDAKKSRLVPSWNEFFQSTSLHGIKYIFDRDSPFVSRRVLWLLFVLGCISYFVIQVGLRISTFYEFKSVVDVQILYTDRIDFPAVTICNQNMFRELVSVETRRKPNPVLQVLYTRCGMTKVADLDLYPYIDQVFSTKTYTAEESDYTLPNLTSKQFMELVAHQREDLIDSCTWRGKPCDLDNDFTVIMTDIGICHTFSRQEQDHFVTESGSGFGLSLILNVEQYEYMKGPQNDAGAKVLLHDRSEYPRVRQLGFGVAPGIHTLVGVKRTQVTSLSSPYGNCTLTKSKYRSGCQVECVVQHVIEDCHCQDFFMNHVTEKVVEPCNISTSLTCVQPVIGMGKQPGRKCKCPVSCDRVVYEPSLSYVQLSRFNIDKMILRDPIKKSQLTQQYQLAKETSQRVIRPIVAEDIRIITSINSTILAMDELLNSREASLSNLTIFAEQNHLLPIKSERQNLVTEEKTKVLHLIYRYEGRLLLLKDSLSVRTLNNMVTTFLPSFLEIQNDNQSLLLDRLKLCSEDMTMLPIDDLELTSTSTEYYYFEKAYEEYRFGFNKSQCRSYLQTKYLHSLNIIRDRMRAGEEMEKIRNPKNVEFAIENLQQFIYTGTGRSPDENRDLALLREVALSCDSIGIEKQFNFVKASAEVFVENTDLLSMLNVTSDILKSVTDKGFMLNDYGLVNLSKSLNWIRTEAVDTEQFTKHMEKAETKFPRIEALMGDFQTALLSLNDFLNADLHNIASQLSLYLSNRTSKLNISEFLNSYSTSDSLGYLENYGDNLKVPAGLLSTAVTEILLDLQEAFDVLYNASLPVLSVNMIQKLVFVSEATKHVPTQNLSQFYDILDDLGKDDGTVKNEVLEEFFAMMLEPYTEIISELETKVTFLIKQLYSDLISYQDVLAEYYEECKINQNFFLKNFVKVDVFYRDLAYERIEQQAALGPNALLGDIGGYLGLLLGASVLTLCEILDYLILRIIDRMGDKSNRQ